MFSSLQQIPSSPYETVKIQENGHLETRHRYLGIGIGIETEYNYSL